MGSLFLSNIMLQLRRSTVAPLLAASTVVGLWLFTQPYIGLRHDAVLYLAQALRASRPQQFAEDLFFAYGSQDSLSIYSLIFGPAFAHADVWPTQPILLVASHAAFLAALWRLLPARLSTRTRWLGMAAITLLRPTYGGLSVFSFCEPFLTARTLAEPLALWSLVLARNGRLVSAWLLVAVSAALHPLMALSAAATLWLMMVARDRRWLGLLPLLGLPLAALAWHQIPPFNALLQIYPTWWWTEVTKVNEQVLVGQWVAADWAAIATDVALLLGAYRLLYRQETTARSGWIGPLLTACLSLVLLAIVGSQWTHNELLTQLQLWRGLWLVRALSIALTPAVLLAVWQKGPLGPATAASIGVVLGLANLHWPTTWLSMIWPLLHFWIWRSGHSVSLRFLRLSVMTSALALLCVGCWDFAGLASLPSDDTNFMNFSMAGIALVSMPMLMLALLAWAWGVWRDGQDSGLPPAKAAATLALLLLLAGAWQWDRRTAQMRFLESHLHSASPFEAVLPAGAEVFWDDNLAATWFIAKRPSYFARQQGAGILFNEGTAKEFANRRKVFQSLMDRRGTCEGLSLILGEKPGDIASCDSLAETEVTKICGTSPTLGYIVTRERFTKPARAVWQVPGAQGADQYQYLYDCSTFR